MFASIWSILTFACGLPIVLLAILVFYMRRKSISAEKQFKKYFPSWDVEILFPAVHVKFSPDGKILVAVAKNGCFSAWQTSNWHRIAGEMKTSSGWMHFHTRDHVCFDKSGTKVAIVTDPKRIDVFSVPDFVLINTLHTAHKCNQVLFDESGEISVLSSKDASIFVERPNKNSSPIHLSTPIQFPSIGDSGCLTSDGLYTCVWKGVYLWCFENSTGKLLQSWEPPEKRGVTSCVACPGTDYIAVKVDDLVMVRSVPDLEFISYIGTTKVGGGLLGTSGSSLALVGVRMIDKERQSWVTCFKDKIVYWRDNHAACKTDFYIMSSADPDFDFDMANKRLAICSEGPSHEGSATHSFVVFNFSGTIEAPDDFFKNSSGKRLAFSFPDPTDPEPKPKVLV